MATQNTPAGGAPEPIHTETRDVSRQDFLETAARIAAGTAAAAASLGSLPVEAASARRHAPQVMRKGSQVTLTYYFGANPPEAQLRQKLFAQFEAANPDIKIVSQLDGTAHLQKLNTEIAGGNPPDLMMAWELDYAAYCAGRFVHPPACGA